MRTSDAAHRSLPKAVNDFPERPLRPMRWHSWAMPAPEDSLPWSARGTPENATAETSTVAKTSTGAAAPTEQQFQIAFHHAPSPMAMLSLVPGSVGRYIEANGAFCAMLGRQTDDIVALPPFEVTHPHDRERERSTLERMVRREIDVVSCEKRLLHKDGHSVLVSVTGRVAPDARGAPLYLLVHAADLTQRRREQAELERLALSDPLTGLANRTLLNDRLDQALARLNRERSHVALLLLDVDRFKLVNETLGREAGDALLVAVATRIEAVTRADATVARIGGDEFVVLAEGLSGAAEVHGIAERLLEALRKPYALPGRPGSVLASASIGVAIASAPDRSPAEIYREADLARYRAKDAGRDQYALFDDELRARVAARTESENLLRRAVRDDLFVPHYQPIVDLAGGHVVAVEALARISDPARGVVHPPSFIEVAERTGMIRDVDLRMLELAVGDFANWSASEQPQMRHLSLNVSEASLQVPGFAARITSVLRWYDVPAELIRIEVTERSLLATGENVHVSLRQLADLGVHVGWDDFGSGYSAITCLANPQLQFLKIDASCVSRLSGTPSDDAVVASVVDLAHAHDLLVVAEGVETPQQLGALRAMGCDWGQGFLFAHPVDRVAFEELLDAGRRW